jgi:hypothetical protein
MVGVRSSRRRFPKHVDGVLTVGKIAKQLADAGETEIGSTADHLVTNVSSN